MGRKDAEYYDDPNNSVGYLTRMAFRAFARTLEQRTAPRGVSIGQWRFLRALWIKDGITQRELSRRVGLREPSTVNAVKSLERDALVVRVPCSQDRRRIHIHLTPKARRLKRVLMPRLMEVNVIAMEGISDADFAVTQRVLQKVRANLEASIGDEEPGGEEFES